MHLLARRYCCCAPSCRARGLGQRRFEGVDDPSTRRVRREMIKSHDPSPRCGGVTLVIGSPVPAPGAGRWLQVLSPAFTREDYTKDQLDVSSLPASRNKTARGGTRPDDARHLLYRGVHPLAAGLPGCVALGRSSHLKTPPQRNRSAEHTNICARRGPAVVSRHLPHTSNDRPKPRAIRSILECYVQYAQPEHRRPLFISPYISDFLRSCPL